MVRLRLENSDHEELVLLAGGVRVRGSVGYAVRPPRKVAVGREA